MPPRKTPSRYLTLLESVKAVADETTQTKSFTHTRIPGDRGSGIFPGSYNILPEQFDEFMNEYYQHVFVDKNTEHLTEKQIPDGPILIDLDFRYSPETTKRQHTHDSIISIMDLYLEELKKILSITTVPFNIYIFEKPNVNILEDGSATKDGIHIIIGIKTDKAMQTILRTNVLANIKDKFDIPITNTWESVLDEGITAGYTNWQLYGSRKPNNEAYQLKYIYVASLDEEDDEFQLEDVNINEFDLKKDFLKLSARYNKHPEFNINPASEELYNELKNGSKSKSSKKSIKVKLVNRLINGDFSKIKSDDELDQLIEMHINNTKPDEYKIKETHNYVMALPKKYYGPGSYSEWIRVGWALKNTDERLFLSWLKMSSNDDCRNTFKDHRTKKFNWKSCVSDMYNEWMGFNSSNSDGLSRRSIMYWVKNDAPAGYKLIRQSTIDYFIDETLKTTTPTDYDLAAVLHSMFKDRFICSSIRHNIWHEYIGHKWEEIDSGNSLRLCLSTAMHQVYVLRISACVNTIAMDDKDQMQRKQTLKLLEITTKLKMKAQKDNIMREAKELFYDKNFNLNIDTHTNLLCFNNGIVDFKEKVFRDGRPEDYITKSTLIDYISLSSANNSIVDEVNEFISQLFPIPALREYMVQHLASCLIGTNNNQTFNIYTGKGCNGKSKLTDLMTKALGQYKGTVPITLITQKRNGIGGTSSEVAQLEGIRYAVMQEPSKGDKINEGIMKEITGGDPIQARALYKETATFIPQFKLVVCTNTLFEIDSNDEGTWRRIRVCDFKSKFTENPVKDDEDNPYQFKINKNIDEKFDIWKEVFMAILVDKAYQTDGLVEDCDMVLEPSNKYRISQDYLAKFDKEKISRCVGSKLRKTELLHQFKEWYKTEFGGKVPASREIEEYIDKKYGKRPKSGKWENIAIIYDDEDEDDEDNENNL